MEQANHTPAEQMEQKPKKPVYRKTWIRVTALVLAVVMVFSLWAGTVIRVKIQPGDEMEAATNYLVDNTDYVSKDELARLQDQLQAYQKATELEDYYNLASTQIAKEEYAEALVSIEKCLELYPGGDEALHVDLLLKQACLLVLLLRNNEALAVLDQVIEKSPYNADAHLIKAQIYAEQEQMEPLRQVLERYLELRPNEYEIRLVYAQVLFEQQDFEAAIEQYEWLLKQNYDSVGRAELLYLAGLTYLQLSDYTQAEQRLAEAQTMNSALDGIHYYIGICRMSLERYSEAVESFSGAIGAGSMIQHSHYSRGVCLLMVEPIDLDAAMEDLEAAAAYSAADADPAVQEQAQQLIDQLQTEMTVQP